MMNKIKIKHKLLIYSFLTQLLIICVLSFTLYDLYKKSIISNIDDGLDIIMLDVYNDLLESNDHTFEKAIFDLDLDEADEFDYKSLGIRLSKLENNQVITLKSNKFVDEFTLNMSEIYALAFETPLFKNKEGYFYEMAKVKVDDKSYIIEVITDDVYLQNSMQKLLKILFIISPLILLFSLISNYILIRKSFLPVKDILDNLRSIQSSSLSKRLERSNNNDEIDLLNQEINNLLQRLEISFEKISQFSSDASHELKTPLTIIRGEIEIALRKQRDISEYKKSLESCLDEILIIQQTVDDLLFLAKSDEQLEQNYYDVYLDEISLDAVKELQNFAKLKKIIVQSNIEHAMQIRGHSKLLKIAIKNVLKNAITFSHEYSKVVIRNYEEDDAYVISIEDFGIGIAFDDQEKIFEKFYRTDKSRNKESGGTGLGMAIVKKIIQIHHGVISLKSEENVGTTVIIKFFKEKK